MRKERGIFEKIPGSGVWWIRYVDSNGKYRREKAGTYAAAQHLYHKRKTEALQGKKLPELLRRKTILFGDIADDCLRYSEGHKKSWQTDRSRIRLLKQWFGSRDAAALGATEMERVLEEAASAERWADATYNHFRALLGLCYKRAVRAGKVSSNPARDIRHRKEDNNRVRCLTDEEETRLRRFIPPEHMPEFDLALNTGLRRGTQYSLTWNMVDWDARTLHIPGTIMKSGKPLHPPLNDTALAVLRDLHACGDGTGFIFRSAKTGLRLQKGRYWFDRAIREAEIEDFHWHDLRHTFASRLREKGTPLEDIADLLGHSNVSMTHRYAHIGPSKLLEVVRRLDATDTPVAPEPARPERQSVSYVN